jgi:hypothetical protein
VHEFLATGSATAATPRTRPPAAPPCRAEEEVSDAPPTFDAAGAFARSLVYARSAPSGDLACGYLEGRFGADGFRHLLEVNAVGIASRFDPDPELRRLAQRGYRVVLPIYAAPSGEITAELAPASLNIRSVRADAKPRYMRPKGGGSAISFGAVNVEVGAADSGTLAIVEGAGDYLRARSRPRRAVGGVLGYVSAAAAPPLGEAVAREVDELRALGMGGPRRVVLFAHPDEAGERAAQEVAHALARLDGLEVARVAFNGSEPEGAVRA